MLQLFNRREPRRLKVEVRLLKKIEQRRLPVPFGIPYRGVPGMVQYKQRPHFARKFKIN